MATSVKLPTGAVDAVARDRRRYPDSLLVAVLQGQSDDLPMDVAMFALQERRTAAKLGSAQGAMQPPQPSVREQLAGPQMMAKGGLASIAKYAAGDLIAPLKKGKTLSHLAAEYGVSVEDLLRLNKITDPTTIPADTPILIKKGETPVAAPAPAVPFQSDAAAFQRKIMQPAMSPPEGASILGGIADILIPPAAAAQGPSDTAASKAAGNTSGTGVEDNAVVVPKLRGPLESPTTFSAYYQLSKQRDDAAGAGRPVDSYNKALAALEKRYPELVGQRKAFEAAAAEKARQDAFRRALEAQRWPKAKTATTPPATTPPAATEAPPNGGEEGAKKGSNAKAEAEDKKNRERVLAEMRALLAQNQKGLTFEEFIKERDARADALGIKSPTNDIETLYSEREKRLDDRAAKRAESNQRERGVTALLMARELGKSGRSGMESLGAAFGVAGEEAQRLRAMNDAADRADEEARYRLTDARAALKAGDYKRFTDSYDAFWKVKNDQNQINAYIQKAIGDQAATIQAATIGASARAAASGWSEGDMFTLRATVWGSLSKDPQFNVLPPDTQVQRVEDRVRQIMGIPTNPFTGTPTGGSTADFTGKTRK